MLYLYTIIHSAKLVGSCMLVGVSVVDQIIIKR